MLELVVPTSPTFTRPVRLRPHELNGPFAAFGLSAPDGLHGALYEYEFSFDPERQPMLTAAMLRYWHPRRRSSIFIGMSHASFKFVYEDGCGVAASPSPEGVVLNALLRTPEGPRRSKSYGLWWSWADDRGLGAIPGEPITVLVDGTVHEARYDQLSASHWLLVFPHALEGTWVAVHGNMRVAPDGLHLCKVQLPNFPAECALPPLKRGRKPRTSH